MAWQTKQVSTIMSPVSPITQSFSPKPSDQSSKKSTIASPRNFSHWLRRPRSSSIDRSPSDPQEPAPAQRASRYYSNSTRAPDPAQAAAGHLTANPRPNTSSMSSLAAAGEHYNTSFLHPASFEHVQLDSPKRGSSRLDRPFTPDVPDEVLFKNTGNWPAPPMKNSGKIRGFSQIIPFHTPRSRSYSFSTFHREPGPSQRPGTLSLIRAFLRLFVLLASMTVVVLQAHSLSIFDPNKWFQFVSLVPSMILLGVAFFALMASLALLVLSVWKKWTGPAAWTSIVRLILGSTIILTFLAGLILFKVLDNTGKGSLRKVSCKKASGSGGFGGDFQVVCSEQDASFWISLAAAVAETSVLACIVLECFGARMPWNEKTYEAKSVSPASF